jgi:hypothetical protein
MKAKLIKTNDEYRLYVDDVLPYATSDNSPYKRLSKQNCDSLFGVVDVEKLAKEESYKAFSQTVWINGFKAGFNKAMELNKDKVFTLEDMKRAFSRGKNLTAEERFKFTEWEAFTKLVDSIQPTEIDVEIIMKNSRTGKIIKSEADLEWDEDGLCDRAIPKLDSSGNLILKKI